MQKKLRTVAMHAALATTLSMMAGGALAQNASDAEPGKPFSLLQLLTHHAPASKASDKVAAKPEARMRAATTERAGARTAERSRGRRIHFASHHKEIGRRQEHETVTAAAAAPPPAEWPKLATPAPAATAPTDPAATAAAAVSDPNQAAAPAGPQVSELVVGGHTVQIASPDQVNAIDLAADQQATDQAAVTATPANAAAAAGAPATAQGDAADDFEAAPPSDTADAADAPAASDQVVAFAREADGGTSHRPSWLAELLATLGGAIAAGSVAWFLIGSAPQRRFG